MALSPAEQELCTTLRLTEAEYLATKIGVSPEEYRLEKAERGLTERELAAARGARMTPQEYAARKAEMAPPTEEEYRITRIQTLRGMAAGSWDAGAREHLNALADRLEAGEDVEDED